MLRFGFPEWPRRPHLSDHSAWPQTGGTDVCDRVRGDLPLLVVDVEDRRPVTGTDVVALTIQRRGIMNLKEELAGPLTVYQQFVITFAPGYAVLVTTTGRSGVGSGRAASICCPARVVARTLASTTDSAELPNVR